MPRPRRALFVTTVPDTLRAFLKPFAAHFRARGWQVDAAASGVQSCPELRDSFDKTLEVPFSRQMTARSNFSRAIPSICQIIRHGDYDVVHVHSPIASLLTRFGARKDRGLESTIVIYTAHGFHFFSGNGRLKNLLFHPLERLAARWTDYLFTINSEDYHAAQSFSTIPRERVLLTSGIGVDPEKYGRSAKGTERPPGFPVPTEAKYVLDVAEFTRRKRPWDAIEAFRHVSDCSLHLVMAGEGELLPAMRDLAGRLGLERRIHFLGYRTDVPILLQHAELLLLPSSQEGLPRCVMEAFCAQVPVIATDIRGSRDLLANGAGLIVPIGQPHLIAAAISRLLHDPHLRSQVISAAQLKLQEYSFSAVVPVYEKVYSNGKRRVEK